MYAPSLIGESNLDEEIFFTWSNESQDLDVKYELKCVSPDISSPSIDISHNSLSYTSISTPHHLWLGLTNNTEYTFKIRTTYIPDNSETMISAWSNEVKVTPNYCIIFDLQCQVEADHYSKTNNILQYNFSSEDITGGEIIENSLFVFEDILFKDITDEIIQPIDDTIIDQSFNLILKPDVNTTKSINSFVVHIGDDSVRFKTLNIT